jgi:zinc/manganese transport system substrate-binding protein
MKTMLTSLVVAFALAGVAAAQGQPQAQILTTTMDLADFVKRIGGDHVSVESFARGDQDLHRISAQPKYLLKLNKADGLFEMGLDMEHAWLPALIEACRNDKVRPGGAGFFNMSGGLKPLEVPTSLDRSGGTDFHPSGNPHYNLSIAGGRLIAKNTLAALKQLHPGGAADFKRNYDAFIADLDKRAVEWRKAGTALKGKKFVSRHAIWPYLAKEFEFEIVGDIEPKPGIEPTPSHTVEIKNIIRSRHVTAIIVPPYLADGLSRAIADDTGVPLVVLPIGVTGSAPAATWIDLMDHVIRTLSDTAAKADAASRPSAPASRPESKG